MKNSYYSIASLACLLVSLLFVYTTIVHAETVSIPNSFSAGTTISASEMNANFIALKTGIEHNKAGITCNSVPPSTDYFLTSTYNDIYSVSITAPAPGTIYVTATGTFVDQHTQNNADEAQLNITITFPVAAFLTQTGWIISNVTPGGMYSTPFSLQSYFNVPAAGTYTFNLGGKLKFNVEPIYISGSNICALFFPN